jgi:hypothetical protein
MVFRRNISIILLLLLFPTLALAQKEEITPMANFYADYVDLFGEPPKVLILNKQRIDLAKAAYLFSSVLADKPIKEIRIKGYNDNFVTTNEVEIRKQDIIRAAKLYSDYIEKNRELPYLVKINKALVSNSDFIYLLADTLRSNKEITTNKKLYFEKTIDWNSKLTLFKPQKILFTVDYESDRPVYSKDDPLYKNPETANDVAVSPLTQENICYKEFCTLPDNNTYTSAEVAWFTEIRDKEGNTLAPECYPYCGTLNATDLIIDDFVNRYNFPLLWFMTGRSIIALAKDNRHIDKIKDLEKNNQIALGLHTMYHSNLNKVSDNFLERTLNENNNLFKSVFNLTPVEFRTPYLDISKENKHIQLLKSLNIQSDNEVSLIDPHCYYKYKCNYEFSIDGVKIARIDWRYNESDPFLNIFLIHPWNVILEETGSPIHLEFSEDAKMNAFKNWIRLTGKYGLVPVLPKEVYAEKRP